MNHCGGVFFEGRTDLDSGMHRFLTVEDGAPAIHDSRFAASAGSRNFSLAGASRADVCPRKRNIAVNKPNVS
jgi:hypothetical protein